jgi:predicted ATPase/transcriptional regulator with XRE-family HTH domain
VLSPDVTFGALLRRHRLAAGLTQEGLADRAGLSAKAVSDLERDPGRTPRLDTVTLLADALALAPEQRADLLGAARPVSVPPGAGGLPQRPRQLVPRPLTPLIGRAGVAAALVDVLRRGDLQLLTLTGPGGVGKTRVAIEVARRLADDFTDGVVFVDLAPLRDSGLVLATVGRRLGVDERDATPLHELLTASLQDRHLLLLLDNFEHVLEARHAVLGLLEACPGLVTLVTSRVALRVRGGQDYRIAPLTVPQEADSPEALVRSPAGELFLERARADGTELRLNAETAPAVAEICRRLGGLPLAIELAAARLRLLPLPTLLSRLDRHLPLLEGGPHDLPDRQRTMRDTITWSYRMLNAPQQALLRRLSVFAGGCTPDAVEAVCPPDDGEPALLDRLAALVDSSLVRLDDLPAAPKAGDATGGPRVVLLDTIREYGLDQLSAEDHADASARHAAYYLSLSEGGQRELAGPATGTRLARLEREHGNLRAALGWAVRTSPATAVRLAAALSDFWEQRGYLSEGRRWLSEILEDVDATVTVSPSVQVQVLLGAATLAIQQAAYSEAEIRCAQAFALAEEHGDQLALIAALNTRGLLARHQDRYADAGKDHRKALASAAATSDLSGEAAALYGLASVAMFAGDVTRAKTLLEESLAVARRAGDQRAIANAGFLLSWQATNAGRYEQAEAVGAETLVLCRSLGNPGQTAEVLFALGTVAQFKGEHDRAATLFGECLVLHRRRGDEHSIGRVQSALGITALHRGDPVLALTLLEAGLAIERRYEDRWGRAMSLTLLAHAELAMANDTRAQALLTEAAGLFQEIGNPLYLSWCLEGLAGVAAVRGRHEHAADLDGARETVRNQTGMLLPPAHPAGYARTLAAVRDALGEEAFDAARTAGGARPVDQTIVAALADA